MRILLVASVLALSALIGCAGADAGTHASAPAAQPKGLGMCPVGPRGPVVAPPSGPTADAGTDASVAASPVAVPDGDAGVSTASPGATDAARAITALHTKLVACYERGLTRERTMKGTATFTVQTGTNGRATGVEPGAASGVSQPVVACVHALFAAYTWTPPPTTPRVAVELRFIPPNPYDGATVEDATRPHDPGF